MADVCYDHTTRQYPGSSSLAVDGLDLQIADGEFMVLVGPSGSGKTTALRMLAGLEDVDAGQIRIGGKDVTHVPPKDRDIAMVFQNYALYPHKTVGENIGFALKMHGIAKPERDQRVRQAAQLLGLEDFLHRKPKQLSGGQRQRVAMGRAIVREPRVFLMDEPLSNLDAKLRVQTRTQIAELQRRLGVTTVYVTHDQVEAMTIGDRVAVLRDGRLQQVSTPRELYRRPRNVFVAGFIGSPAMNLLDVAVEAGTVMLGGAPVELPAALRGAVGTAGVSRITLGLRPEHVTIGSDATGPAADVTVVEELGSDAFVHAKLDTPDGQQLIVARTDGSAPPRGGDRVRLRVSTQGLLAFHPDTELRLES